MAEFYEVDKKEFERLIEQYKAIQQDFLREFGVNDIFSNSKIYEIIIANSLGHVMIPGHSGSKDARDDTGNEFEYKHYKETSSNHTWTFNDFSDTTIENLNTCSQVIFAHVDNTKFPPVFDWCYCVPGTVISGFLKEKTPSITNTRKMINVSRKNIEEVMGIKRKEVVRLKVGLYDKWIDNIYSIAKELEKCTKVRQLLTSNKIWEVLVAVQLGHNVNSEQGGRAGAHDAFDRNGKQYEYKVSKNHSWNFQDISDKVLEKYLEDEAIILAVVDKTEIAVTNIYSADPQKVVARLKEKLNEKRLRFEEQDKLVRRLQVSLSRGDLKRVEAKKLI